MGSNLNELSVAILGCGFMGTALLEGWLKQPQCPRFFLSVQTSKSLQRLRSDIDGFPSGKDKVVETGSGDTAHTTMSKASDIVILACPPGDLEALIGIDGLVEALERKTIVSLLAGVSYASIKKAITSAAGKSSVTTNVDSLKITRVIPSLGARMGVSVSLLANSDTVIHDERIEELFKAVGDIQHVPELSMDKATALGAVCHALTILASDTMADASAAEGLPRALSLELAAKCMRSCSSLLAEGMGPESVKDAMAVPKGITINAFLDLEKRARGEIAGSVRNAIRYAERMA